MKKTILVVDDNNVNRMMLRGILDDEYEVLEAENGWNALNILNRNNDDKIFAIVLDLLMPVMDGFEFLAKVKEDAALSKIPIFVISQLDDEKSEIQALSLGAVDFLSKPYQGEIIRLRIRNLIKLINE